MEEKEHRASVPYFEHEGVVNKLLRIIRYLIIALVITLAVGLLYAYANNRAWMNYVDKLQSERIETAIEEVIADAGVYQQSDPGTDR